MRDTSGTVVPDAQVVVRNVAQVARIDFDLAVGEVREIVTVSAETPMLSTERATIGQVICSRRILDLPLNGRDFTQLSTLVPGASAEAPTTRPRHR